MIEIKIVLNRRAQITVSGNDEKEVLRQLALFSALPPVCPVCQSEWHFNVRHPQKYEYFSVECEGRERHESSFGVVREGGRLFYKQHEPWKVAPWTREEES